MCFSGSIGFMEEDIRKAMMQGIVFKKAADKGEKKIKFSDFLRGTHGSDSAKWKASFKYKKMLRKANRKNK